MTSAAILSDIQTALQSALSSPSAGSVIASLLHANTATTGLDIKNKTMTTSWVAANESTAILLEAEGYTITVG